MNESLLGKDQPQMDFDENKNYLEELVGEGKKFSSPEDLAKGKAFADQHISVLESRFDELRNDYNQLRHDYTSRASLEEMIDELRKQQLASRDENQDSNEVNNEPRFNPDEVKSLISEEVNRLRTSEKEAENFNKVENKLKERFGKDYKRILNEKAASLGLGEDFVNNLAKSNPTVFYKTFDLDNTTSPNSFQTPPHSTSRSDSFAPTNEKRTWAWYQELKKKDPTTYYAQNTTIQMEKDYQALGKEFEDGDFQPLFSV